MSDKELREALEWYGEQARLARLVHSEGDKGRFALAADGGKRAKEVLSKTIYWSGTEEREHHELQKACDARCKQWGKEDCPRPDHWCSECEHDQAVAMRTTDPAEIAAIERGDF